MKPTLAQTRLLDALQSYMATIPGEFDQISPERKAALRQLTTYIQARLQSKKPVRLTFICTHNSRRSHLSQLWALTAAYYYGLPGIETYSGGTEATAFNPRAVRAIRGSVSKWT